MGGLDQDHLFGVASGNYDGRPCDTEAPKEEVPCPPPVPRSYDPTTPDGFDYVKAIAKAYPNGFR
jgi:hypothetical protein